MAKGFFYICDECGTQKQVESGGYRYQFYKQPEEWKYAEDKDFCSLACLKSYVCKLPLTVEKPKRTSRLGKK